MCLHFVNKICNPGCNHIYLFIYLSIFIYVQRSVCRHVRDTREHLSIYISIKIFLTRRSRTLIDCSAVKVNFREEIVTIPLPDLTPEMRADPSTYLRIKVMDKGQADIPRPLYLLLQASMKSIYKILLSHPKCTLLCIYDCTLSNTCLSNFWS